MKRRHDLTPASRYWPHNISALPAGVSPRDLALFAVHESSPGQESPLEEETNFQLALRVADINEASVLGSAIPLNYFEQGGLTPKGRPVKDQSYSMPVRSEPPEVDTEIQLLVSTPRTGMGLPKTGPRVFHETDHLVDRFYQKREATERGLTRRRTLRQSHPRNIGRAGLGTPYQHSDSTEYALPANIIFL